MSSTKSDFFKQPSDQNPGWKTALRPFVAYLALYFALYSVIRGVFYLWNVKQFQDLSVLQLGRAFANGLRFDAAAAVPLCTLIVLAWYFLPRVLFWITLVVVTIAQCGFILGNFVDIELINFVGRRSTKASLYLFGEGRATNLARYVFLTSLMFVTNGLFVVLQMFVARRYFLLPAKNFSEAQPSFKIKMGATFLLLAVTVIALRGGLQTKPISYVDAKVIDHPFAHQLVLNTTFTFFKSMGQSDFERLHFFDENKMLSLLNLNRASTPSTLENKGELKNFNVVVIVLESFSSEYINQDNTPFFLSLANRGAYFPKAYANGRRSIEGIAAILAGIPALMEESFISSEFSSNDFIGLGKILKNQGYQTGFFHGAQNGSMRFDTFTKAAGFDEYFGKNQFPDQSQDDGSWGIFDEPFLKWTCEKMTEMKPPFANVIFTLSSHQPFTIPEAYKNVFKEGSHPILKSIRYTDEALKNFFACAEKQPWHERTLYVLTADHTGPLLSESISAKGTLKAVFEVPLVFYTRHEDKLLGLKATQFAQHIDILPTISEAIGAPLLVQNHLARSLWQPGLKTIALYTDQHYELVGDGPQTEEALQAIRQYFSQGLYDNRLYFPAGSGN